MQIDAQGLLNEKEFKLAIRLSRPAYQRSRAQTIGLILVTVACSVAVFIRPGFDVIGLIVAFYVGFYFAAISISHRLIARVRQSPLLSEPIKYHITDHGVEARRSRETISQQWDAFTTIHDTPDLLVLRSHGLSMAIFPRRFFASDEDWQTFAIEARRRLGRCRACGYHLKGSISDACPECGKSLAPEPEAA